MTLKDYAKMINDLVKAGHGDKIVIAAADDEGNSYSDVTYTPSLLNVDEIKDVYNGEGRNKKSVMCIN